MTEAEWLECDNPEAMLVFLGVRAGDRKCRLFACACCRRVWHLLREGGRERVEWVERWVDGLVPWGEVASFEAFPDAPVGVKSGAWEVAHLASRALVGGVYSTPQRDAGYSARCAANAICTTESDDDDLDLRDDSWRKERAVQAGLLREVFGNPFRTFRRDNRWMTFQNRFAFKLALTTYRNGAFADLPILADALEEAGCSEEAILSHLRSPGPHVRGCWALDLILGRGNYFR